jgi:hypothetical protein
MPGPLLVRFFNQSGGCLNVGLCVFMLYRCNFTKADIYFDVLTILSV